MEEVSGQLTALLLVVNPNLVHWGEEQPSGRGREWETHLSSNELWPQAKGDVGVLWAGVGCFLSEEGKVKGLWVCMHVQVCVCSFKQTALFAREWDIQDLYIRVRVCVGNKNVGHVFIAFNYIFCYKDRQVGLGCRAAEGTSTHHMLAYISPGSNKNTPTARQEQQKRPSKLVGSQQEGRISKQGIKFRPRSRETTSESGMQMNPSLRNAYLTFFGTLTGS